MMRALFTWLLCVGGALAVVAWGVRMAGRDARWVGRHLAELLFATFALAYLTAWAGTKGGGDEPGPGPSPEPSSSTNEVTRIPVGRFSGGRVLPYGAPVRTWKVDEP